jgi:PPM family protein phosphatase
VTKLRVGSATDVGMVRSNNQDQVLVASPLFAVADGMGGHVAGEVASLTAIEALRAAFDKDSTAAGLVAATKEANRAVWEKARHDPRLRGMGTTLVALALVHEGDEEQLAIVNVGDSRVYRLQQGELEQLTTDHRLVQELIDDGQLSEAEATYHPQRHVLTRALGVDAEVPADSLQVVPYKGDRFLLCSDGLSGEVGDSEVASILRRIADPQEAAKELVAAAMANGGSDNITVVVVDVVDDDDKAATASAALAADPGLIIPSELGKGEAEPPGATGGRLRRGRRRVRADDSPKARVLTFRFVGFVILLLILLGGAAGAVGWYARGTYYVGLDSTEVTIYKGRPGGLLWFNPTVAKRTGVPVSSVLPSRLDDLRRGKEEASLDEANKYVANLQAEALAHRATTVTTTIGPTTSTTAALTTPIAPTSTASALTTPAAPTSTSVP